MSTYAVPEDKLTAIADAIRLKRDTTAPMSLDDMATQIALIDGGGGEEVFYSEGGVCYVKDIVVPADIAEPNAATGTAIYYCMPNLESITNYARTNVNVAYLGGWNCPKLKAIRYPKGEGTVANYFTRQQGVTSQIEEIQLGSVGHAITGFANTNWNYGNNHAGCTITIYCDKTSRAAALTMSNVQSNTSKCTLIFRSSVTGEILN